MSKPRLTALFAVFLVAIAALVVAGCGGSDDSSSTSGGETSASTEEASGGGEPLTVGSDIPYPPFEEGKPGNYTGFDIDLMDAIGEKIGRTPEFQDTSFDTIFTFLAQGKFEAVASAATITPEREKTVDFSNPYYISEQAILIKKGGEIGSVEELKGATIGVQKGTTGQEFVDEKGEAGEVRPYPTGPDAVNALNAGTVEAVVMDIPVAENAVEANKGLEISSPIETEEEYGIAVAQGETELLESINEGLATVIEDGTYNTLYEKWFHHEAPAAIKTATHEAS
ncbi:MAG TPA: basic amino acid ABC transporter substrate-binding protein [Solirubrobacterales bacterium]|nr:basic amino acid ABC transporter substrate-binding protein [Solirubrobacterales bacterium]